MKSLYEKKRFEIASRAIQAVGTPFKLHGRSLRHGLDCVGLVAHSISPFTTQQEIPQNYTMRFTNLEIPKAFFEAISILQCHNFDDLKIGDIVLISPGCQQLHFIIITGDTYVHAHSNLRRIVSCPLPIEYRIKAAWRYKGE